MASRATLSKRVQRLRERLIEMDERLGRLMSQRALLQEALAAELEFARKMGMDIRPAGLELSRG